MSTTTSPAVQPERMGWEEEVVPTLRKRLQAESLILSHRISYLDTSSPTTSPIFPNFNRGGGRLPAVHPTQITPSTTTLTTSHTADFQRQIQSEHFTSADVDPKSSSSSTSPPNFSRIPVPRPSNDTNRLVSPPVKGNTLPRPRSSRSPSGSSAESRNEELAGGWDSSKSGSHGSGRSAIRNETRVRARTKSTPMVCDDISSLQERNRGAATGRVIPPVPIPRQRSPSQSVSKGHSGLKGLRLRAGTGTGTWLGTEHDDHLTKQMNGRSQSGEPVTSTNGDGKDSQEGSKDSMESVDLALSMSRGTSSPHVKNSHKLSHTDVTTDLEKPIRDEKPPFVLVPVQGGSSGWVVGGGIGGGQKVDREEAMRIAERGWEMGGEQVEGECARQRTTSVSLDKVMNKDNKSTRVEETSTILRHEPNGSSPIRSSNVGLKSLSAGRQARKPSSRRLDSPTSRSISSSDFGRLAASSGTGMTTSQSTRSIASTREREPLPIAAYLIPKIVEYTPPKGGKWDDMVLPAVARKMAMTMAVAEESGEVDVWGRKGMREGPEPRQNQHDSGYEDVLDAYHDEDTRPITGISHTRRTVDRLSISHSTFASPSTMGEDVSDDSRSHPNLPLESTVDSPHRLGFFERNESIRKHASQNDIRLQRLGTPTGSMQHGQAQPESATQAVARTSGELYTHDFDATTGLEHELDDGNTKRKGGKDGHGGGCRCVVM